MIRLNRPALLAGAFAVILTASACGTSDSPSETSSSSSSAASSSSATSSPANVQSSQRGADAPVATTNGGQAPQTTTPVRDDDPGGQPCTDQSGAPGHYIDADGQWICEVTGDAPQ